MWGPGPGDVGSRPRPPCRSHSGDLWLPGLPGGSEAVEGEDLVADGLHLARGVLGRPAAHVRRQVGCAIGSWGARRPSLAPAVKLAGREGARGRAAELPMALTLTMLPAAL